MIHAQHYPYETFERETQKIGEHLSKAAKKQNDKESVFLHATRGQRTERMNPLGHPCIYHEKSIKKRLKALSIKVLGNISLSPIRKKGTV
jgi:hypothetical protein